MFKTFPMGELFECAKGDIDLQQKDINGKGDYFINSGLDNRGIKGKTDRPAKVFPSNTITIDFWGNAYYRDFEYKLATHNHVFSLSGPVIKNKQVGLYLEGALSKLSSIFSYNNMATWNKLKDMVIELPVVESADADHEYTVDDIDYEYMQERIAELEQERIAELDAYLAVSGLDDYELTDDDKEILSLSLESASDEANASETDFGNGQVVFKAFKVSDVFNKVEAKCKKADFDKRRDTSTAPNEEYCVPLVNAKVGDNGIMFYGRKSDWNTQEMCIDVIQNGAVATGTVYAQPQPVGVLWDAYLIKPVVEVKTAEALLYMAKCIEKITKEQFSYDKKATWDRVKTCEVSLPVASDGNINFDYMERYIRAIEKLAIADVAKYKDKLIAATKQVVGM